MWKSRDRLAWGDAAKDAEIAKGEPWALWERDAERWLAERHPSMATFSNQGKGQEGKSLFRAPSPTSPKEQPVISLPNDFDAEYT